MPTSINPAEEGDPGEWLPCAEWTGPGSKLPRGGWTPLPMFMPTNFVYRWKVMKPEDTTIREVKSAEIEPDDILVGAKMNETMLKALAESYGEDDFVYLKDANTNDLLSRTAWRDKYGTDGLALWALRDKRMKPKKPFEIG